MSLLPQKIVCLDLGTNSTGIFIWDPQTQTHEKYTIRTSGRDPYQRVFELYGKLIPLLPSHISAVLLEDFWVSKQNAIIVELRGAIITYLYSKGVKEVVKLPISKMGKTTNTATTTISLFIVAPTYV
jgi:hypothetical protein